MIIPSLRGFTLLEVITVIIVVAVMAAIGLPRFFNTKEFNDGLFSRELISTLRFAQTLAMTTHCDTQIVISSGTVTLTQRDNCVAGASFNMNVFNAATASNYILTIPSEVIINLNPNTFYFDTMGRALDVSNNILNNVITIGTHTIILSGATGYAYEAIP